jgi:hypothetical protein
MGDRGVAHAVIASTFTLVVGSLPLVSGCGEGAGTTAPTDGGGSTEAPSLSPDGSPGDTAAAGGEAGDATREGSAADASRQAEGDASGAGDVTADTPAGSGGDVYGPWAGGAAYYGKFSGGPPSDPSFFPIAVWLQDPSLASQYAAIGINLFIGLWQGPTDPQLAALAQSRMPVACDQNSVGLAHRSDKTVIAWTQEDEPDNAQAVDGGYGPCIAPAAIVGLYQTWTANDPTRPVFLNFGQAVANDAWVGRGSCSGHNGDYAQYANGADIVSFDVYPVNSNLDITLVAKGVDRLGGWVNYQKPVWNWIECTGINAPSGKPTPAQTKAEVWMSIIHGSMGIGYFVHQFAPTQDVHALLDDPVMKGAVASLNAQITSLAPVLNTPPITNAVTVSSSNASSPVDMLAKRQGTARYVFAVSMGAAATTATFSLARAGASSVAQVLGEGRTVVVANGMFQDDFAGYAVHLYEIP